MTLRAMYVAPLVLAGTALAATVFADQLVSSYDEPMPASETLVPGETVIANDQPGVQTEPVAVRTEPVAVRTEPVAARAEAPGARADTSSATTIYGERRSEDEFITDDVVKALASEPRISGKIGVETYRRVVTLTGRVSTQGQVDRITRVAQRAVDRDVEVRNHVISKV